MAYLGFLPESKDTYLTRLPDIICFSSEEMVETIPQAKTYLDDKHYMIGRSTVEFKMVVSSKVDFHDFALWYANELNRGSEWFHAELLFFGIIDVFRCRFTSDLTEKVTDGIHWAHVKLEIDEFYNKLLDPTVKYVLTCGDITACNEALECI